MIPQEKKIKIVSKVKRRFNKAFKSLNKISLSSEDKKKANDARNPIDALIDEFIDRFLLPNAEIDYTIEPYKVPETPYDPEQAGPSYLNEGGIL